MYDNEPYLSEPDQFPLGDVSAMAYSTALRILQNTHDAEDVAAAVTLNYWQFIQKDKVADVPSFVFIAARNAATTALKQRQKRRAEELTDELIASIGTSIYEGLDHISETELCALFDNDEESQDILRLRIRGYKYEEIAARLNQKPHIIQYRMKTRIRPEILKHHPEILQLIK